MAEDTVRDALIVAGGRGTRLQPLTYGVPKPLLPFCGEPFVVGVMRRLRDAGVERTWLVVGADTEPFERLDGVVSGMAVRIVPEPEPLDTAGGIRAVADELDDTHLVLNGDVLTDLDPRGVIAHHRATGADATLVLTRVDDTSAFGVCVRDGTRIIDFVEKPPAGSLPGQDMINAGTYVLEPGIWQQFPTGRLSFERQIFPGILERGGHIEGHHHDGVWADLGTPDRFLDGQRHALDGALPWPSVMAVVDGGSGVRVAATATVNDVTFDGPVLVLDRASIEAGAHVGPNVVVGADVVVARDAILRNSTVMAGSRVSGSLDGVVIGEGSTVSAPVGRGCVIGHGQVIDRPMEDGERIPPATG